MYAIAFFTTVILFSASLYIGNKIAESVNNRKSSTNAADYRIVGFAGCPKRILLDRKWVVWE